jgi:hypothetical protein
MRIFLPLIMVLFLVISTAGDGLFQSNVCGKTLDDACGCGCAIQGPVCGCGCNCSGCNVGEALIKCSDCCTAARKTTPCTPQND